MLIDLHTHTGFERHPRIARANGTHYPTPERLIAMMDSAGIDKAVILSTVSPEWRYCLITPEETMAVAEKYPERIIPYCNFDPRYLTNDTSADFMPLLEAHRELGCKGIGEYIPNIPVDDPLNMNFFSQVEKSGFSLTFHLAPAIGGYYGMYDELGLPRLEKALRAFPDLTFMGHSQPFWAEISADVTAESRAGYPEGKVKPGRLVELMRACPNLHGDLSAGSGFNAISRDPEFGYAFMEEFHDRLYWATDIANDPQQTPIVEYFQKLKQEGLIPRDVYEDITWRNANRLLKLGLDG